MSHAKYAGFEFATKSGIIPASRGAGTFNGEAVDRLTYGHAVATLHGQGFTTGGETLDVRMQDSENGTSGWANYTPNSIFDNNNQDVTYAAFPQMTTNGIDKLDVDLSAAKRYIRFVGVVAGGTIVYQVAGLINQPDGVQPGATA